MKPYKTFEAISNAAKTSDYFEGYTINTSTKIDEALEIQIFKTKNPHYISQHLCSLIITYPAGQVFTDVRNYIQCGPVWDACQAGLRAFEFGEHVKTIWRVPLPEDKPLPRMMTVLAARVLQRKECRDTIILWQPFSDTPFTTTTAEGMGYQWLLVEGCPENLIEVYTISDLRE